jgi:tetratricopeptide (TPR) repeat protein
LTKERPGDVHTRRLLSMDQTQLGRALQAEGRRDEARQAWRRAIDIIEPAARGTEDKRLLDAWARPLIYLGLDDQAKPVLDHLDRLHYRNPDFVALRRGHGLLAGPGSARPSRSTASSGGPSTQGEETHDG